MSTEISESMPKQEAKTQPAPRPFPYWPPVCSEEEMKRVEVMNELNKWANNDPFMAKRSAETLIMLIANQFEVDLNKIDQ